MSAIYRPFKSIEEIKQRGEFIPKGRIYPARIIRAQKRSNQYHVRSGSNQWAFPTPSGYILFVEHNDGHFDCVVRITQIQNGNFNCSPYTEGETTWRGNYESYDDDALYLFNKMFLSKCLIGNGVADNSKQLQINGK